MKQPKHPPMAYVEWVDSANVNDGWQDREDVLEQATTLVEPIVAAGFLIADDKRGIILSLFWNEHADHVGPTVVIPRSAVRLVRMVRPGRGFTHESESA
jgi:hypothetical protein